MVREPPQTLNLPGSELWANLGLALSPDVPSCGTDSRINETHPLLFVLLLLLVLLPPTPPFLEPVLVLVLVQVYYQ